MLGNRAGCDAGNWALPSFEMAKRALIGWTTIALFAGDRGGRFDGFPGTEVAPAAFCAFFEERGRGVDGKGMGGDLEHGEVVARVSEDGVRMGQADAAKRSGFGRAGGNIDKFTGDQAVYDFDLGGEDALLGNAKGADAFRYNPLVGGTDSPEFDAGCAELVNEAGNFRKDVRGHVFGNVAGGGGAQFLLTEAGVDLHHFATDAGFVDGAGKICAVASVHPIGGGTGDESLIDGPDHESVTGIATPKGAVAIEYSYFGGSFKDKAFELLNGPAGDFKLGR
jgi:hypothetical protein